MINLGDYSFFLGGCKIFGLFLGFGLGLLGLRFVGYLGSGFADGELLSFTRVKESNQRKHAPTKPLFPFLLKIFLTEG